MNSDQTTNMDEYVWEPPKKRNPFVMAGALVTAGVLFGGLVAFRQGKYQLSQTMMRARVLAQGATVALMVGSSGYYAMQAKDQKQS